MRYARVWASAALVCVLATSPAAAWQYQKSATANGVSEIIPIDLRLSKCGVSLIVTFSSGASLTATVQVTGDDIGLGSGDKYRVGPDYVVATGKFNNHDTLVSLAGSANGNLWVPATGVRLNVSGYSSGTVTLAVVMSDQCQ